MEMTRVNGQLLAVGGLYLNLCFFETGVIGGVSSVFSVFFESAGEPRSSAARLDGGGSLSFSRLCSFFGSWSRRTFSRLNRRAHPERWEKIDALDVVGGERVASHGGRGALCGVAGGSSG